MSHLSRVGDFYARSRFARPLNLVPRAFPLKNGGAGKAFTAPARPTHFQWKSPGDEVANISEEQWGLLIVYLNF